MGRSGVELSAIRIAGGSARGATGRRRGDPNGAAAPVEPLSIRTGGVGGFERDRHDAGAAVVRAEFSHVLRAPPVERTARQPGCAPEGARHSRRVALPAASQLDDGPLVRRTLRRLPGDRTGRRADSSLAVLHQHDRRRTGSGHRRAVRVAIGYVGVSAPQFAEREERTAATVDPTCPRWYRVFHVIGILITPLVPWYLNRNLYLTPATGWLD